jgi:hypothetical protein
MNTRARALIIILPVVSACGGFVVGRLTTGNASLPTETRSVAAPEDFQITLSENSKPEEGLYVVLFQSKASHMYYFSTYFGFTLKDDAVGFEECYDSSPHGEFSGYDLLPHTSVDLQARLVAKEGYLEHEQGGTNLYPSSSDTIYLRGFARVSELHRGTCRQITFELPLHTTPLKKFMDDESLRNLQKERKVPFDFSKLPPPE